MDIYAVVYDAVVYDAVVCVCICECGVCECVFVVHMCGDVNC